MLTKIADGAFVHESAFLQSNSVVLEGIDGVLLIDPGISGDEMTTLASDIQRLGQPVVAGFSTHPHWDHLLWHPRFGDVPRYATATCAASVQNLLANPEWKTRVAGVLPAEYADQIPMQLFGLLTALPSDSTSVPWNGPGGRLLEHRAHAAGHAALVIDELGVLVAGDMLSDTLIPFLDLNSASPIDDYLTALNLLDAAANDVDVVVPGHGTVGRGAQVRARIEQDRAYVEALRDHRAPDDARLAAHAPHEWLMAVHESQAQRLAQPNHPSTDH